MESIKKLIVKPNLEQHEMQYVVEQYIKKRKGVDVQINLLSGVPQGTPQEILIMHMQRQLNLLFNAFEEAVKFFANKK